MREGGAKGPLRSYLLLV
uniref:Uncharacterized protein n=1 Tax=Anguilla anguilla TaxID=7936 RepID=A0A0E9RA27_ANGAN